MPEVEDGDHDERDAEADGEEDAIGGEENEQSNDGSGGDDEGGGAFLPRAGVGVGAHRGIL